MSFLNKCKHFLYTDVRHWKNCFLCWCDRYLAKPLRIMDEKQTIDYVIDHQCSVARFGDGELNIMAYGQDIGFQNSSEELRERLKQVISSDEKELLICISNRLNHRKGKAFDSISAYWQFCIKYRLHDWLKMIPFRHLYGDANISRLIGTALFESKEVQVIYTKKIWDGQNVILIEGEGTRFGVGNNLLDNVKSCKRIICPAVNAFDVYDRILESAIQFGKKTEHPLFLLALGPTAKVLSFDLCNRGYRAIDIGHLDLCYERAMDKEESHENNRYDNEVEGGEIYYPCTDEEYILQTVDVIK